MVALRQSLITLSALLALVSAAPSGRQVPDKRTNSYGSSYGSSNSNNYGGSYGNNNNNNNYMTTTSSSMMMEKTTTPMMEDKTTSSMMKETTTTSMMKETTTTSSMMMETTTTSSMMSQYTPPSYGSGGNNWGNNGYNDCVQQCMVKYAPPPAMYTPPSSSDMSGGYGGSKGSSSGKMWTITVAPIKGVLRFVPFAVNASVGDTVRFKWANGPHSVTSSSILEPCNATSIFDSQLQNSSFTFDQVVKDTNPQFFYCKVPNHCAKGMFGVINPPQLPGGDMSVANMMPILAANNSDLAAQMMYTKNIASKVDGAWEWGQSMSLAGMSPDAQLNFVQNTLQTRLIMGSNPDQVQKNVLTPTEGQGLSIPMDIAAVKADASGPAGTPGISGSNPTQPAANAASSPAASNSASNSAVSSSPAPSQSGKPSAALRGVSSSTGTVAIVVLAATFFAL